MIHRVFVGFPAFDAMFVAALALAAYIHLGHVWLIYVICIFGGMFLFRMFKDASSWFQYLGDQINFLARCIRDHD